MPEITEQTRVPFGREKGRKLCECSDRFLQWMVEHLLNTDHHFYAHCAKGILETRADEGKAIAAQQDLEAAADELLRNVGCGHLCGATGRRRRRVQNASQ